MVPLLTSAERFGRGAVLTGKMLAGCRTVFLRREYNYLGGTTSGDYFRGTAGVVPIEPELANVPGPE
jgi:hypothetical protein